jgi:hypothetical protein
LPLLVKEGSTIFYSSPPAKGGVAAARQTRGYSHALFPRRCFMNVSVQGNRIILNCEDWLEAGFRISMTTSHFYIGEGGASVAEPESVGVSAYKMCGWFVVSSGGKELKVK